MDEVKFKYGTEEQYNNIEPDDGTFYRLDDENENIEVLLGEHLLSGVKIYQMPKTYDPIFGNNTPEDIKKAVTEGVAEDLWSIGDTIAIELDGTVGDLTFNNETYYAFILGFDHNADLETNGKNSLTLGFCKVEDGSSMADIAFSSFQMNPSNNNEGGWEFSYMRQTICHAFFNVLPFEWQNVISTIIKYTDNTDSVSSTALNTDVTATEDQIFLLAEYEVQGECTYANSYEQNLQCQYSYYVVGNRKSKGVISYPSQQHGWWTRSICYFYGYGLFCFVDIDETAQGDWPSSSYGFAPAFCIVGD